MARPIWKIAESLFYSKRVFCALPAGMLASEMEIGII
jgi:hypothetical protein